jgi:hypothetical protein
LGMTKQKNNCDCNCNCENSSCNGLAGLVADLGQKALPVFLVAAVTFLEVFEDALEVGVAA